MAQKKKRPQEVSFSGVIVLSPAVMEEYPEQGLVTGDEIEVVALKGEPIKAKILGKDGQTETLCYEHLRGFMQLYHGRKEYHLLRLLDGKWLLIRFKGDEPSKMWRMVNANLHYSGNSSFFDSNGKLHMNQTSIHAAKTFSF